MGTREVPLSNLIAAVVDNRGRSCPTTDDGIPLIATNCIRNELLYPTYEKARFVSQETYSTWFRGHPEPGDILFVNKATPGRVCLVPDPVDFCIAQDMVAIRANRDEVYPLYLLAALRSPVVQERIAQMHVGTLIPHFKKGDFDKLLIPIPSEGEQVFIGDLYFSLSAKIDLNRRMSDALEAMARALFKSWFVDFDPVRAKVEGRDPGLPQSLAKHFPARLVDSELGEIPEGWEVTALGDLVDVEKGLSYKGAGLVEDGGLPMINLGCFAGQGQFLSEKIKRYQGEYRERHLVRPGDLLIANTDMTQNRVILGSPALVPLLDDEQEYLFTHHTFALRFKPGAAPWKLYVYFALLRSEFREIAEGYATGTTVLALPRDGVLRYPVALPSDDLRTAFEDHAGALIVKSQDVVHAPRSGSERSIRVL